MESKENKSLWNLNVWTLFLPPRITNYHYIFILVQVSRTKLVINYIRCHPLFFRDTFHQSTVKNKIYGRVIRTRTESKRTILNRTRVRLFCTIFWTFFSKRTIFWSQSVRKLYAEPYDILIKLVSRTIFVIQNEEIDHFYFISSVKRVQGCPHRECTFSFLFKHFHVDTLHMDR